MKRSIKFLGSSTGLLAIAAFAGLINGASSRASAATTVPGVSHSTTVKAVADGKAGVKARNMDDTSKTHDCKGKNDCKGQGGCKTGDNGCKGKNSCKGNGGCKTSGSGLMF
jgi:hypothetical protein